MIEVPLPVCSECNSNKDVIEQGPDFIGSEYVCKKCNHHWVQET